MEGITINNMKNIIIKYLLLNEVDWKTIELKPEDFFDSLEQGGKYSVFDSVEKHFLEPRNYLKEEHEKILFLTILISDELNNKTENKYTYWDNGQNQIKETIEYQLGILSYRTIIFNINISHNLKKTLTFRVEDVNSQLVTLTQII